MKIRAIQKVEINGRVYWPGEFIEGLSDKEIKKGIAEGYLAEKPTPKSAPVKKKVEDGENS